MNLQRLAVAVCLTALAACGDDAPTNFIIVNGDASSGADAGTGDAGSTADTGSTEDTGVATDTGTTDDTGGTTDTGSATDTGTTDDTGGTTDTGSATDTGGTTDTGDNPDVPSAGEVCDNGADDDGDELIDCLDPDCLEDAACAPVCGDGEVNGAEECDGSDAGCAPGEACSDACLCVPTEAVCGDGVAEGSEECDGADDAACGAGWVCDDACACDGPPRLDAFTEPVLGGADAAVIPSPNRSGGVCTEFDAPHGLQVRVSGESTADIIAVEVQRGRVDATPISVDLRDAPISAGAFDERVDLCLPTLEEGESHQITLLDALGRRSTTRSFTLPTLEAATLTSFRIFLSRDEDAHVLQITGEAPSANVASLFSDLETSAGPIEDFESRGWPLFAEFSGGQFYGATSIGGLSEVTFTIDSYTSRVTTYGGLESATRDATPATTVARSGGACVPVQASNTPTCTEGFWCAPGSTYNAGTCVEPRTAPPTLSDARFVDFTLRSPNCEGDFPNELTFAVEGTNTVPVTAVLFAIPGTVDEPVELATLPFLTRSFSEELGLCFNGTFTGETVDVSVVDEAGRTSETLSFLIE